MKYCFDYHKEFRYINQCDQINYHFDGNLQTLVDFLQHHSKQQVNLIVAQIDDIELRAFEAIYAEHKLFKLLFTTKPRQISTTVPYYFNEIITNWEQFHNILYYGVSDIFIGEALCFELDKVAPIAHNLNILIHVYANVAQSYQNVDKSIHSFFIRPEDVPLYEDYIDVIEFFGDATKYSVYYKIYVKSGKWLGPLSHIIIGLQAPVDNRYITPLFAKTRISCGKKCIKGKKCNVCALSQSIANSMADNEHN